MQSEMSSVSSSHPSTDGKAWALALPPVGGWGQETDDISDYNLRFLSEISYDQE